MDDGERNTRHPKQSWEQEQQALQQLLRAEAAFREVQVSMQQNDPSGNGAQAARNFAEMFELEMDLEKSQYESESQLSMQSAQQELDEAIRKFRERGIPWMYRAAMLRIFRARRLRPPRDFLETRRPAA